MSNPVKELKDQHQPHVLNVLANLARKAATSKKNLTAEEIKNSNNHSFSESAIQSILETLEKNNMVEKSYTITDVGKAWLYYKAKESELKKCLK